MTKYNRLYTHYSQAILFLIPLLANREEMIRLISGRLR